MTMMARNCLSTTITIKNCFLVVIHLSLLEVLAAATTFKISDLKVSESKYGDYLEVEDEEYTLEVESYEILEQKRNYRDGDRDLADELLVNSVFLELLIFICCAAGVFGICIFCCIVCGQLFNSNQDGNGNHSGDESLSSAFSNNRAIRIQHGQDETILTFISVHRNPWSPVFEGEHEAFRFENDDMPPQYDDLDLSSKPEELYSPPPPPYTPSFNLGESGEKK